MPWVIRDIKREAALINTIEQSDDRSAAILAASYLEDRLTFGIHARLIEDIEIIGKLFKGYGPLASFAAKIDLAYLMRMFAPLLRNQLHTIREVRNRFAHRLDIHSFVDKPISDLCFRKLLRTATLNAMHIQYKSSTPETHEILVELVRLLSLKPDTARNAYLNTIKLLLGHIEMHTQGRLEEFGKPIVPLIVLVTPEPLQEKLR